jgi:hypothetical protein
LTGVYLMIIDHENWSTRAMIWSRRWSRRVADRPEKKDVHL